MKLQSLNLQWKTQIVALACLLAVLLSSVQAQDNARWSGTKCGIDDQKIDDRSLGFDTCNDYCSSPMLEVANFGYCALNSSGYGECKCGLQGTMGATSDNSEFQF